MSERDVRIRISVETLEGDILHAADWRQSTPSHVVERLGNTDGWKWSEGHFAQRAADRLQTEVGWGLVQTVERADADGLAMEGPSCTCERGADLDHWSDCAVHGATWRWMAENPDKCPTCRGEGTSWASKPSGSVAVKCLNCRGTGMIQQP